tara:strand:- start:73 stop:555 length:483 start_codon:yes stop_codon:yes gene_type:complete
MSILNSISRSVKNLFVGSHKGEDINLDAFEEKPLPQNTKVIYTPQPPPGFVAQDPPSIPDNQWFENPLDKMPVANGSNKYAPAARRAELEAEINPRPEEKVAEWFEEKKEESKKEEEKSMHQKMYEMATARYNPFSLGGSENCDSDLSCNVGGSENAQKL